MPDTVVLQTSLSRWPVRRGKVRDIYDLGGELLLVSTDRISAFDWVLPTGIPDKGRVLTQLSAFWFDLLDEPNQMLSADVDACWPCRTKTANCWPAGPCGSAVPGSCRSNASCAAIWPDRPGPNIASRARFAAFGCPPAWSKARVLPEPIFTPATKAETGHDENISFDEMADRVGRRVAEQLRDRSLAVYRRGAEHARERGILIADTKFEWGWWNDELILIDEVLTPDSSRFWPADQYQPGQSPPSFDKQFVRDWLTSVGWDKNSPPPPLPDDVVRKTREKYVEAYERLSGRQFAWK